MGEFIVKLRTKMDEVPSLRIFTKRNEQIARVDLTPDHIHGHFVFVNCDEEVLMKVLSLMNLMGIHVDEDTNEQSCRQRDILDFADFLNHLFS